MKKLKITLATIAVILLSISVQAQTQNPVAADTVFVLSLKEFRDYITLVDSKVDSKTITRELIAFIEQRGRIIPKQPADKPKTEEPKKKD